MTVLSRLNHTLLTCSVIFLLILQCSLRSQIIITELMASADENYRDSDGAPSDWIEITNSGNNEASLEGCYLTNNNADPTRWIFPQTKIPAGNSIVVFASGKDRKDANELHTSFTLDRGGDYLGLIGPDGFILAHMQ